MSSISDNKLNFPYPHLIMSDNKNICQTWENALQDSEFKNMYDDFTEEGKKTIDENLSSRICLTVDNENVPKCYTTNRKFETCGELAKEAPNSLTAEMETLKIEIQTTKTQMMNEMLTFVNQKREQLTTLIDTYTAKQDMVNMNQGYHDLAADSIEEKKEKKSQLVDSIDQVDNLKNNASQIMTNKRKNLSGYQNKNNWINRFMWWFLLILLIIITLYLMSLPLTKKTLN
jgi:DNA repair ATPase RecN